MAGSMKAIRYHAYGSPEVLRLEDVAMPAVGDGDVLVRVKAASVNPLDWHFMRGTPYLVRTRAGLLRPRASGLGADLAGSVAAVGKEVTGYQPGDEVFGELVSHGTFAEYVSIPQDGPVLAKPSGLSFEEAAAVPVAGFTALQAVRDKGQVQPGHTVLINGAAGGVGTFAVQLARAFGAEVTGVCSSRNVELVASLGASHVIDYTREDFTRAGKRYDVLVDIAASQTLAGCRRVLTPEGVLVGVGGPDRGRWFGPLLRQARMALLAPAVDQTMAPLLAHASRDDLGVLRGLIQAGKVTPVIDRVYPLAGTPDAIRYLEQGHARGKVVITM